MFNIADIPKLEPENIAQLKSIFEKLNEKDKFTINALNAAILEREQMIATLMNSGSIPPPSTRVNGNHNGSIEQEDEVIETPPPVMRKGAGKPKETKLSSVEIPEKYDPNESKHIKSLWVLRNFGPIMTRQQIIDKIMQQEKRGKGSAAVANLDAILSQQSKPGKTLIAHKQYDGKSTGYELREDLK